MELRRKLWEFRRCYGEGVKEKTVGVLEVLWRWS